VAVGNIACADDSEARPNLWVARRLRHAPDRMR
jgi:hypothetical protein